MLLIRLAILVKSWTQKLKKTWKIIPSLPLLFSFNFPHFFHLMALYMLDQKSTWRKKEKTISYQVFSLAWGKVLLATEKVILKFLVQLCKQRIKLICAFIWTIKYFEILATNTNSVSKEHKASLLLSWLQMLTWQCLRTKIQLKWWVRQVFCRIYWKQVTW